MVRMMKHILFESLGDEYPYALEEKFDRILTQIEKLWGTPALEDYFTELIIDKRGGRQGFTKDVLGDILLLRQFHRTETIKRADDRERSLAELKRLGIPLSKMEFLRAVEAGDRKLVDLFIQSSFNIHVTNDQGEPPLMIAIKKGFTVIALMLIKAGAEVNEYDKMGETPLLLTCGKNTEGCISIAERLIYRGAFINERDRNGNTPLMLSIAGGTDQITKLLIEKKADVHAGTRRGKTPLSLAMEAGNKAIVELLIQNGAVK